MKKTGLLLIPVIILIVHTFLSTPALALGEDSYPVSDAELQVEPIGPDLNLRQRMEMAYPPTLSGVNNIFYRNVNADMQDWPEMNFVGEPVMLEGRIFMVEDVKIISGSNITIAYAPDMDQTFDTPNGAAKVIEEIPVAFIPPNSSLVMVKIMVDSPFESTTAGCMGLEGDIVSGISPRFLRIAYPGVGEFEVFDTFHPRDYDFGLYNSSQDGCLNSGWYYFYLPLIDPDPQEIWLTYTDILVPELFTMWTLIRYH